MSEVRFTDQHEWVRLDGDEATIGITKYAADQLGDVVYVELPDAGTQSRRGRRSGGGRKREGGERSLCADVGRSDGLERGADGRSRQGQCRSAKATAGSSSSRSRDKGEFAKLMTDAQYAEFVKGLTGPLCRMVTMRDCGMT